MELTQSNVPFVHLRILKGTSAMFFSVDQGQAKLLALDLGKGEKKITFHIVQPTLNQVSLSFTAG